MRGLLQLTIIFALWQGGELLSKGLNLPIPGSIIGMILLFILLSLKIIRLEWIQQVSDFLLGNMGILFVPIGVSLLVMTGVLKQNLLALVVIVLIGTIVVMVVSGLVTQWLEGRNHG